MQLELDRVRQGYSIGMRSGNVEYGLWCKQAAVFAAPYIVGKSLRWIAEESKKFVSQVEELEQNEHALVARSG